MHRPAFSLIELLIVISIIAVLAALLMPTIAMVRERAIRSRCMSNQMQLGLAFHGYANDWEGYLPADNNFGDTNPDTSLAWYFRIPTYVEAASSKEKAVQCPAFKPAPSPNGKSLKMNDYFDSSGRPVHYLVGQVPDESKVVLLADGRADSTAIASTQSYLTPGVVDTTRHRGTAVFLHLDGHTTATLRMDPALNDWRKQVRFLSEKWPLLSGWPALPPE